MILSYIRTVILYLILILVIRLMGKRQIGEMEPAEFVVTMLVANLAAIPMQDAGIPLLTGCAAAPCAACSAASPCCSLTMGGCSRAICG